MRSSLGDALVENNGIVLTYFHISPWPWFVKYLTWSTARKSVDLTGTPLDDLVKEEMARKEERLEAAFKKFMYHIDGEDTLRLVRSTGRFEQVSASNPLTKPPSRD